MHALIQSISQQQRPCFPWRMRPTSKLPSTLMFSTHASATSSTTSAPGSSRPPLIFWLITSHSGPATQRVRGGKTHIRQACRDSTCDLARIKVTHTPATQRQNPPSDVWLATPHGSPVWQAQQKAEIRATKHGFPRVSAAPDFFSAGLILQPCAAGER